MEFEAKAIQELPVQSGVSKAGKPWKKREWVVETFGSYPRKVKIQCFGDRSDNIHIEIGKTYAYSVDLESREFNDRWYTDVSVYAVREVGAPTPPEQTQFAPQQPAAAGFPTPPMPFGTPAPGLDPLAPMDANDDLPF